MNDIKVTVHHLLGKCQNYASCLCCGRWIRLRCQRWKGCQFFCLHLFKAVRLLNRSWFILERSHVLRLRAVEKDLSPAALVAGFTRISLHNVITSFIISCSWVWVASLLLFNLFLFFAKKQKSPSLCAVPEWEIIGQFCLILRFSSWYATTAHP